MKTPSPVKKLPIVVIVGPTAAGKTELAIELAGRVGGEIVSVDSRLFYRGMDIGTAKPSLSDRQHVPHHLVDVANPNETWSLALFQQEARKAIEAIIVRGKLPILVGGTGQYVWSVVENWQVPVLPPRPQLRRALARWGDEIGPQALHQRLVYLDPAAAGRIDPRNVRRTVRALEVILHAGKRFSGLRRKGASPYRALTIGLRRPRQELFRRIDARIEGMFDRGFLDEVRDLLQMEYGPELPSMSAIGYREAVRVIAGEIGLEEAKARMRQLTHQFVRRQANWFKDTDPNILWIDASPDAVDEMEKAVNAWLALPNSPLPG